MLDLSKLQGGTLVEYKERWGFLIEGGRGTITKIVQDGNSVRIETDAKTSFETDLLGDWEQHTHEGVTYLSPTGGLPTSLIPRYAIAPANVEIPTPDRRGGMNPMDLFQ